MEGIDVAHRQGTRESTNTKPQAIMFLVALCAVSDFSWKKEKNGMFLREKMIHFGEDLTKTEKHAKDAKDAKCRKAHKRWLEGILHWTKGIHQQNRDLAQMKTELARGRQFAQHHFKHSGVWLQWLTLTFTMASQLPIVLVCYVTLKLNHKKVFFFFFSSSSSSSSSSLSNADIGYFHQ